MRWPTSAQLWQRVFPFLAQDARVLAPDLLGFGASDKADAASDFEFHVEALHRFVQKVAREPVGLVLHDLAGPVGLTWALRNQAWVDRIALLNT